MKNECYTKHFNCEGASSSHTHTHTHTHVSRAERVICVLAEKPGCSWGGNLFSHWPRTRVCVWECVYECELGEGGRRCWTYVTGCPQETERHRHKGRVRENRRLIRGQSVGCLQTLKPPKNNCQMTTYLTNTHIEITFPKTVCKNRQSETDGWME